jgi:hypothetical protein
MVVLLGYSQRFRRIGGVVVEMMRGQIETMMRMSETMRGRTETMRRRSETTRISKKRKTKPSHRARRPITC